MQPSYYGSGVTPARGDTRLMELTKILGKLQNLAGSDPANNPGRNDTRYTLLRKWLRAVNHMNGTPE